jgi:hypothetical protein
VVSGETVNPWSSDAMPRFASSRRSPSWTATSIADGDTDEA